jgi:hypothetical protein
VAHIDQPDIPTPQEPALQLGVHRPGDLSPGEQWKRGAGARPAHCPTCLPEGASNLEGRPRRIGGYRRVATRRECAHKLRTDGAQTFSGPKNRDRPPPPGPGRLYGGGDPKHLPDSDK